MVAYTRGWLSPLPSRTGIPGHIERPGLGSVAASGIGAAVSQFTGMRLPPLVGKIRDAAGRRHAAILPIAATLALGGLLDLWIAGPMRSDATGAMATRA